MLDTAMLKNCVNTVTLIDTSLLKEPKKEKEILYNTHSIYEYFNLYLVVEI